MGAVDAVLFDLDGTLIDSEHLWWRAEVATVEGLGGTWTRVDQEHCLGGPLERVSAYMAEITGGGVAVEVIGTRLLDTMEALLREEPPEWRPGARELLMECRASPVRTALVSASHRRLLTAVADAVARDLGVDTDAVFDATVAGDEVSDSKPHPQPYWAAAGLLGVDISACVVIEDSPTGVASGQASGAFVIAVPDMVEVPPAPHRVVLDSLAGVRLDDLRRWALAAR